MSQSPATAAAAGAADGNGGASNSVNDDFVHVQKPQLVTIKFAVSNTHVSVFGAFWRRRVGAYTKAKDRRSDSEVFELIPVPGAESCFVVRHVSTDKYLTQPKDDGSIGLTAAAASGDVLNTPDVMMVQLERLEDKPVYNVMFSDKSLGMKVSNTMPLTVVGWNDLKSGLPGEAEKIGSIHVGDVIVAVNGEKTDGFTRRQVRVERSGAQGEGEGEGQGQGALRGRGRRAEMQLQPTLPALRVSAPPLPALTFADARVAAGALSSHELVRSPARVGAGAGADR